MAISISKALFDRIQFERMHFEEEKNQKIQLKKIQFENIQLGEIQFEKIYIFRNCCWTLKFFQNVDQSDLSDPGHPNIVQHHAEL